MNPTATSPAPPAPVIPPPIAPTPAPQSTPPSSPKVSKNALYIGIAAVLLVVILGLGFAVFYKSPEVVPTPTPYILPTSPVAPSPTPDVSKDDSVTTIEGELNRTPTASPSGDKKVEGDINGL